MQVLMIYRLKDKM